MTRLLMFTKVAVPECTSLALVVKVGTVLVLARKSMSQEERREVNRISVAIDHHEEGVLVVGPLFSSMLPNFLFTIKFRD